MTCTLYTCEEPSELYYNEMVTARKEYRCGECRQPIKKGERYDRAKGLEDGSWWEFKTCALCAEIRKAIFCSWQCGCMWDDLEEESVFTLSLAGLSPAALDKLEEFWRKRR